MSNNNEDLKVREGYVKIDIKRPEFEQQDDDDDDVDVLQEVDLEDITSGEEDTTQEDEQGVTQLDKENEESEKQKKKPVNVNKPFKRPSRSEKRIRQLHSEKTELQRELEALREENRHLNSTVNSNTFENKTAMKAALESTLDVLRSSMKEAIESGEAEKSVKLNEELINTKTKLESINRDLSSMENSNKETKATPAAVKQQQQTVDEVPEAAWDWIEEHPQFNEDPIFQHISVLVNEQMINEGLDPTSSEFYEELNVRLAPRFPEIFVVDEEDSVEYKNKNDDSATSEEDGKLQNKKQSSLEQTVSGTSRVPPHSKGNSKRRGKEQVTLSPEEVRTAERLGRDLKSMAERKLHIEKNRRPDGYVPILMKKK